MQIKAGFTIAYDCPKVTPTLLTLKLHPTRRVDLLTPEVLTFSPAVDTWDYTDGFGNVCTRLTAPPGRLTISTEFEVYDSGLPDFVPHDAAQHDIRDLLDDTLVYLLCSRYCETDLLAPIRGLSAGLADRQLRESCNGGLKGGNGAHSRHNRFARRGTALGQKRSSGVSNRELL